MSHAPVTSNANISRRKASRRQGTASAPTSSGRGTFRHTATKTNNAHPSTKSWQSTAPTSAGKSRPSGGLSEEFMELTMNSRRPDHSTRKVASSYSDRKNTSPSTGSNDPLRAPRRETSRGGENEAGGCHLGDWNSRRSGNGRGDGNDGRNSNGDGKGNGRGTRNGARNSNGASADDSGEIGGDDRKGSGGGNGHSGGNSNGGGKGNNGDGKDRFGGDDSDLFPPGVLPDYDTIYRQVMCHVGLFGGVGTRSAERSRNRSATGQGKQSEPLNPYSPQQMQGIADEKKKETIKAAILDCLEDHAIILVHRSELAQDGKDPAGTQTAGAGSASSESRGLVAALRGKIRHQPDILERLVDYALIAVKREDVSTYGQPPATPAKSEQAKPQRTRR